MLATPRHALLHTVLALLVLQGCGSTPPKPTVDGGPFSGKNGSGTFQHNDAGWPISPTYVPMFPGAGGSPTANDPLVGGMLCDYVPHKGEKGAKDPLTQCFYTAGQTTPSATLEQVLECVEGKDSVHLRLTFDPAFVDNTYGANAIGWGDTTTTTTTMMMPGMMMPGGKMMMPKPMMKKGGHTWKDLVGSDHAEIKVTNGTGTTVLDFSLDYISVDTSVPSGYSSLGPLGGDGKVISGDVTAILDWNTSIARNFNERGYSSYTTDSPATDANYTPNPAAPDWDFRVVYEAWIDIHAFGSSGFGGATIEYVHASPSKATTNTIDVVPGDCPPGWCTNPDGCDGGGGGLPDGGAGGAGGGGYPDGGYPDGGYPDGGCTVNSPDDVHCGASNSVPDAGIDIETYCPSHQTDPRCMPE